jgi:spermidine synthase
MLQPRQITVVELDPVVAESAKAYMGLNTIPNLRILVMDVHTALAQLSGQERFDLVIEDVFYRGMPTKTDGDVRAYIDSQASLLAENGVLVFNRWFRTWAGEKLESDQARLVACLQERFEYVVRKPVMQRWQNELFFAHGRKAGRGGTGAPP